MMIVEANVKYFVFIVIAKTNSAAAAMHLLQKDLHEDPL
jgi:hypothetical protein